MREYDKFYWKYTTNKSKKIPGFSDNKDKKKMIKYLQKIIKSRKENVRAALSLAI